MSKKVLCLGIMVGDFLVKPVEKIPEKGKLTLVERTELHLGGCAVNTGVVLKKLGVETGIIGKVGNDNLGRFLIEKLRDEGLDVNGIKISEECSTSGTSVLVHSDGERSFLHSMGTNAYLGLEDVDFSFIEKFQIFHIAGTFLMPGFDGKPTAEALKIAKEKGLVTCLDTCWDATGRWLELLKESLPYIDYFLPSIEEAKMLTGMEKPEDISGFLIDSGVKNVCLKMGIKGSFISNGKERYYFDALNKAPVDTTGAGDGYVAGFIAGMVRGFSFKKCGMLANLVGAEIATSVGATSGVTSYEDTMEFGKKHEYSF